MILPSDYSRYVCKRAYVHMFVHVPNSMKLVIELYDLFAAEL